MSFGFKKKNAENSDGGTNEYTRQLRLTLLNLAGETPNFIALLISAITTRAVLVFVDLIDTASNVLRNILVVLISKRLKRDLRYQYNYGVGKIEALSSMLCDFFMITSLLVMLYFAVKDLIYPRPVESAGAMIFVILVKTLNVSGDVFIYWRQRNICKNSDSLVLKSSLSVALKNLVFDLTSFTALILIALFGNHKLIWYLSPSVSLVLGGYLLFVTVRRLIETVNVMLDRSASEEIQLELLSVLATINDRYETLMNVKTRMAGKTVIVDLELGFSPDMTYEQLKHIVDDFTTEFSKKIPKSEVSLIIKGNLL